jgi:hypothetical protein
MERLAARVPPPRKNQVLYHGVLAPRAAWREEIVPQPRRKPAIDRQLPKPDDRRVVQAVDPLALLLEGLQKGRIAHQLRPHHFDGHLEVLVVDVDPPVDRAMGALSQKFGEAVVADGLSDHCDSPSKKGFGDGEDITSFILCRSWCMSH